MQLPHRGVGPGARGPHRVRGVGQVPLPVWGRPDRHRPRQYRPTAAQRGRRSATFLDLNPTGEFALPVHEAKHERSCFFFFPSLFRVTQRLCAGGAWCSTVPSPPSVEVCRHSCCPAERCRRIAGAPAARRPCALRLYGSPRLACARPLRLAAVRRETGKAAVRAAPPVARGPHYVRVCCAAAGPVAPEDTWAEMKDSTEEIRGRSGSRVKVYAGVALVAIAVSKRPCRLLACLPTGDARRGLGRAGDALFRSRLSLSRCGECLGRLQRHAALRRRPTDACACICVCVRARACVRIRSPARVCVPVCRCCGGDRLSCLPASSWRTRALATAPMLTCKSCTSPSQPRRALCNRASSCALPTR